MDKRAWLSESERTIGITWPPSDLRFEYRAAVVLVGRSPQPVEAKPAYKAADYAQRRTILPEVERADTRNRLANKNKSRGIDVG